MEINYQKNKEASTMDKLKDNIKADKEIKENKKNKIISYHIKRTKPHGIGKKKEINHEIMLEQKKLNEIINNDSDNKKVIN